MSVDLPDRSAESSSTGVTHRDGSSKQRVISSLMALITQIARYTLACHHHAPTTAAYAARAQVSYDTKTVYVLHAVERASAPTTVPSLLPALSLSLSPPPLLPPRSDAGRCIKRVLKRRQLQRAEKDRCGPEGDHRWSLAGGRMINKRVVTSVRWNVKLRWFLRDGHVVFLTWTFRI